MGLDARTPVLVGAGACQQHVEDPAAAKEAIELMIDALDAAADDAGSPALLREAGCVLVPKGTWGYRDPGRLVAARFGAPARTLLAEVGILQQSLLTKAVLAIASGAADVALVCGGETKYRSMRAAISGQDAPETSQDDDEPDERLEPHGEILTRLEIDRGLAMPAHQYAVMGNALRHAESLSVAEQVEQLAQLWAGFGRVAARNPNAWNRAAVVPDDLRMPSDTNRMVAFPYTKLHCSQWNVDQAAGLILCSVETAARHRIPRDQWIFPIAATESNAMLPLSRRRDLHRCPAFATAGARLAELANISLDDVEHVDLYSCFPAAVQIQARELGISNDRSLTLTGGMTFAGGPLNNYVLQAVATAVPILRRDPGSLGLVTSVSGMLTKQGLALFSAQPPRSGFRSDDVSDVVRRRTPTVPVVDARDTTGTVAGYTVTYEGGRPARAIVIANLPAGEHTICAADDPGWASAMTREEWCGRPVRVLADGRIAP